MITTRCTAKRTISGYRATVAQINEFVVEAEIPEDASLTVTPRSGGYGSSGYVEIFAEWTKTIEGKK